MRTIRVGNAARFWATYLTPSAIALLLGIMRQVPAPSPRYPAAVAIGVGGLVGLALFVALARRPPSLASLRGALCLSPLLTSAPVVAGAASEEVIWRAFLLRALMPRMCIAAAVALSTGGFALAHARQGRAGVAVHLVTGGAFAAVYLVMDSYVAAIAAHAVYNLLFLSALRRSGYHPISA